MKKITALIVVLGLSLLGALAWGGPYDLKINQRNSTDDGDWARLFPTPPGDASGLMFFDGSTKVPGYVTIGTGLSVSGGALNASGASAFNYGDPVPRTLAMSTSYQATDTAKAAVLTISPSCRNQTTVVASSACSMQVRQHTSVVTCSTGTVVATWTSTVALGLVFDQTSGSPFDVKLGIGRHFILCPTAGTFTITTAVEQTAG